MYPETLFDAREGSDERTTTAIVRHSSSMRRIVSAEFIATTKTSCRRYSIHRTSHLVQILQRMYIRSALRTVRTDRFDECLRTSHRRHTRHAILQRCSTDRLFIVVRHTSQGRI